LSYKITICTPTLNDRNFGVQWSNLPNSTEQQYTGLNDRRFLVYNDQGAKMTGSRCTPLFFTYHFGVQPLSKKRRAVPKDSPVFYDVM
jgi:hypothetical protein